MFEKEERPWGNYCVLQDMPQYKLKRIEVLPGKRLSLQSHQRREELWTIVDGEGTAIVGDREVFLEYGNAIFIRRGQKHRIINTGKHLLIFIEVQTGEYFGEDDIVRYEDDYGRVE